MFIDNLLNYMHPSPDATFLDLGCGKGRHSLYLNSKNYNVTGIDLSEQSIAYAKQFENEKLHFFVHDMRKLFRENSFDFILNVFTSFGYFETEEEDCDVVDAVYKALKPVGIFVLDYFNSNKIVCDMKMSETKTIEGIEFFINKKIENNFIIKNISFEDNEKKYNFQEKVKIITLKEFEKHFAKNNFKIIEVFGNYKLDKFDENKSERLIFVAKKEG
jgi:SAM-dependent methyltransferase